MSEPAATAYDAQTNLYNQLHSRHEDTTALLRRLIHQHKPKARDLLDLGCGTGAILQALSTDYQVTGLDRSPNMLAHAARKRPGAALYAADMADFHLGQKFDVIYSVRDTVNHLPAFDTWISFLACVRDQLKPGGLFILDLSTDDRFNALCDRAVRVVPVAEHYILTKLYRHPETAGRYISEQRIFLQKDPYSFSHHSYALELSAYPLQNIVTALTKGFVLRDQFRVQGTDRDDPGRTVFACQRA